MRTLTAEEYRALCEFDAIKIGQDVEEDEIEEDS